MKQKRGFSLAEMAMVLLVTAIVVTMATSFIVTFGRAADRLRATEDMMNDVGLVQASLRSWLFVFDTGEWTITASEDGAALTATPKSDGEAHEWRIGEDSILSDMGDGAVRQVPLGVLKSCTVAVAERIVSCELSFADRESDTRLLFPLLAGSERGRTPSGAEVTK